MFFSLLFFVAFANAATNVEDFLQKADFVSKQHVSCIRTFSKIGCFKSSSTPSMKLVINDQDPTSSYNKGYLVDMTNFAKSTHSLACRCAAYAAKAGYTYFSIRFWGQCFVGKDYANVEKLVDDPKTHSSPNCGNPKYQQCNDGHTHECLGWSNADYIYSVYGANRNDPNIDGGYSKWTLWSKCSAECGMGVETRERSCTKPIPKGTGKSCAHLGPASETRPCKIKECKIDGGYTQWSKFSVCSRSCGGGISRRQRYCTNPRPLNGGAHCAGKDLEEKRCNPQPCPVHGGYSQWSSYSGCTATCGVGEKTRVRTCTSPAPAHGGRKCDYLGLAEEKAKCNLRPCPVDGGYTNWGKFTPCTRSCGGGQQTRIRLCSNPAPAHGGKPCVGSFVHVEECNTDPCPVHGKWAAFGPWDKCSVTCGGGVTHRRRTCTNPAPDHGGNDCQGTNIERNECNKNNCPINGGFTEWSAFEECSEECGGGVQIRTRECTNPSPKYGGLPCKGPAANSAACNTHHCPIDGGYTAFGAWTKCSKSCGGGNQFRTRSCTAPKPQYGGADCSELGAPKEWRECETQPCARYSKFGKWSTCTKSCGGGVQKRTRVCYAPGWKGRVDCSHLGKSYETRVCETQHCPINGNWGAWTPWGACSKTCGAGSRIKTRQCNNPEAQYGGLGCPGYHYVKEHCHIKPCPINGNWALWSEWGACSKLCGGGTHERQRDCGNPKPQHGGKPCPGKGTELKTCNTHHCPVDGGWTQWGLWRKCTKSCGGGRTYRLRRCTNPVPKYGGERCPGAPIQAKQCGTQHCPIPGHWSAFSSYSECSKSCGSGVQVSHRYCDSPAPQYGGPSCGGSGERARLCNTHPCPIDGKYSAWTAWTPCTYSCGSGTQTRSRTCTQPKYGGKSCSVLGHPTDSRECNTQLCPVKQYHTAHACEGTIGQLSCKKGNGKIHILDGMYGRTKRWICGNVDFWDYNCKLPHGHGTKVVTAICEGKQECQVPATDKMFGQDPCRLTHKYLEVMYQCYGGRYPDLADEEEEGKQENLLE